MYMRNNWTKPQSEINGVIQVNSRGDKLISGKTHTDDSMNRDIGDLVDIFPENIREYIHGCLKEHYNIINTLLASGYEPVELCFRDYLSGPRNEISSYESDVLQEAFKDDRYELVPTIRFANRNLENSENDIAETSSVIIEFHKRGMAF
jgi:hypothetical protein